MNITSTKYKVLITTSGTGSRLGVITQKLNKALIDINGKAAISRIIDSYPVEVPIVITVGYLANQVKQFVVKNHSGRNFKFLFVEKFEGSGSSAGYSILHAEHYLQNPFIFHPCDTIVTQSIPTPYRNWTGGSTVENLSKEVIAKHFRTHLIKGGDLKLVQEPGASGFQSIHIGLTGIRNYRAFWKSLNNLYNENPGMSSLTDTHVINRMIEEGLSFKVINFAPWLDTGNPNSLEECIKYFEVNSKTKYSMSHNLNSKKSVKNLIIDVDGVLTTGQYYYSKNGKTMKIFGPNDSDALNMIREKVNIHMVTGDKRGFAISKKRIVDDMKFPLDLVSTFDRVKWIESRYKLGETIYIGDGIFDALVFKAVHYGIAPANAFQLAKDNANFVTKSKGGEGAVAEACFHIMKKFFKPINLSDFNFSGGIGVWSK